MEYSPVFATPFFVIEASDKPPRCGGTELSYRLTGADSVICCAMTANGDFVMVRQYRDAIGQFTLELPAGGICEGEAPSEAAQREFSEETGLVCDFVGLGDFRLMANRTNIREHIFFGLNPEPQLADTREIGVRLILVHRSDLANYCLTGQYQQLAGIGVMHLASIYLGLDIVNEPMDKILESFKLRKNDER